MSFEEFEYDELEELSEFICSFYCSAGYCAGECSLCDNNDFANYLFGHNYRKVPDNVVMLLKEDFEQLSQLIAEHIFESEKLLENLKIVVNSFFRLLTLYKIKFKELEVDNYQCMEDKIYVKQTENDSKES